MTDATLFNIRTFAIGAPGSEGARASLSEIAFQGLTGSSSDCSHGGADATVGDGHFDMTESTDFVGDLSAALKAITSDKALSCRYDVPEGKVDLNKVNVTFKPPTGEPVELFRDDSAGCDDGANGWQYADDFTQIVLCGSVCDDVKSKDGSVSIVLGCPTQTIR